MSDLLSHPTNYIAAGAVATPIWMPWLQTVSSTAALLLPIVGLIWLFIQIFYHFSKDD